MSRVKTSQDTDPHKRGAFLEHGTGPMGPDRLPEDPNPEWSPPLPTPFRPQFRFAYMLILSGLTGFILYGLNLGDTTLGRFLNPAILLGNTFTWMTPRLAVALAGAIALYGNLLLLSLLPRRSQILLTWVELSFLFFAFFHSFGLSYDFILSKLDVMIVTGLWTTLYVSALSIFFASIVALTAALAKMSQSGPYYAIATFYISFFRGTPLLLQVYLIYLGLPQIGITLDAVPSGIIALTLCYGAYMAEIFRAGIEGVPRGQWEAAEALGLRQAMIMGKIVLPQAMRLIIPPIGNQFIAMLKDSSLVSVMGVWELMFLARTLGRSEFKHLEMLIAAAVIYWIVSFLFELSQAKLEIYFGKGQTRGD